MFDGVLDGGKRADNALVVGDALVGIEGYVEVNLRVASESDCRWGEAVGISTYADQYALALQVDVGNRELV